MLAIAHLPRRPLSILAASDSNPCRRSDASGAVQQTLESFQLALQGFAPRNLRPGAGESVRRRPLAQQVVAVAVAWQEPLGSQLLLQAAQVQVDHLGLRCRKALTGRQRGEIGQPPLTVRGPRSWPGGAQAGTRPGRLAPRTVERCPGRWSMCGRSRCTRRSRSTPPRWRHRSPGLRPASRPRASRAALSWSRRKAVRSDQAHARLRVRTHSSSPAREPSSCLMLTWSLWARPR